MIAQLKLTAIIAAASVAVGAAGGWKVASWHYQAREARAVKAAAAADRANLLDIIEIQAPLSASGSIAAIDQKRALVREAEKQATIESKEARDAFEAARSLVTDPAKPTQPATVVTVDRVAEIRRKQAEILQKFSKERAQAKVKEKGQEQG